MELQPESPTVITQSMNSPNLLMTPINHKIITLMKLHQLFPLREEVTPQELLQGFLSSISLTQLRLLNPSKMLCPSLEEELIGNPVEPKVWWKRYIYIYMYCLDCIYTLHFVYGFLSFYEAAFAKPCVGKNGKQLVLYLT